MTSENGNEILPEARRISVKLFRVNGRRRVNICEGKAKYAYRRPVKVEFLSASPAPFFFFFFRYHAARTGSPDTRNTMYNYCIPT